MLNPSVIERIKDDLNNYDRRCFFGEPTFSLLRVYCECKNIALHAGYFDMRWIKEGFLEWLRDITAADLLKCDRFTEHELMEMFTL